MSEVRGKHRGYAWRVFYSETGSRVEGWRGEWQAPTGETGKTSLPLYADEKAAEEAVISCIDEHSSPTYTVPLEEA